MLDTLVKQSYGLSLEAFAATVLYAGLGVIMLVLAIVVVDKLFGLDMRKELVKENNVAFGVMIAGLSIGISIIIAGTIGS